MKRILLIIPATLLASCMHLGMLNHSTPENSQTPVATTTDITAGDIRAVATFPRLVLGKEVVCTLRLWNRQTFAPLKDATILFQARVAREQSTMNPHGDTSATAAMDNNVQVLWSGAPAETGDPGVYSITYKCLQPMEQEITFRVTAIRDKEINPPLVISSKSSVYGEAHSGMEGSMMGNNSFFMMLGVAAMIAGMMAITMIH